MKASRQKLERGLRALAEARQHGRPSEAVRKQRDALEGAAVGVNAAARAEATAAELSACFAEAVRAHQAGRLEESVGLYHRAMALQPTGAELGAIYCNLGHSLLGLYRRSEALETCEHAVALLPESVEALANLGNVLLELGRIEEAREAYEAALRLNPQWLPAIHNLGTVMMEEGRFNEALDACERTLALNPEFADARLNRGILHLLRGEFSQGWRDYEARLRVARTMTPQLAGETPQWRGEPLDGASILIYAEQGLGDAIQFLRYVRLAAEAGGRVTLVLPRRLERMAAGLEARVIAQGERLPVCDWQCPLMSLPLAIAARSGDWTIPGWKPYLTVPAEERTRAQSVAWPTTALRVGLAWAGSPDNPRDWSRSLTLDLLEPLLTTPETQFYSLQVGAAARQADRWRDRIIDLAPLEEEMADAAAKILELDLVIAADTAVAHLAGALGKPVWLLIPMVPDWRWQLEREDSPWYPKMRIFRQSVRHAWKPVIERVREELVAVAAKGREKFAGNAREYGTEELEAPGVTGKACAGEGWSQAKKDTMQRPVVNPVVRFCKICRGASPLFGVVDFHKSCMEGQGKRLALSGVPVYYRRCEQCGFLATEFFDAWSDSLFAEHIYNVDYLQVDPDAEEQRPANNARLVAEAFAGASESISVLDYGGGSGRLAELLQQEGFNATTYDPFSRYCVMPQRRFDLITAFEVLEHLPDPGSAVAAMASLLKTREADGDDGLILFSTLLQPKDLQQMGMSWWYAAPRNGHCSLYTADALTRLFASVGMQAASAGSALHLAYRRVPGFAAHLRIGGGANASGA